MARLRDAWHRFTVAIRILFYVAGFGWLTWPVGVWGAICLGAAWGLHRISRRPAQPAHGPWARVMPQIACDLRDASLCVASGLLVIAVVQMFLIVGGSYMSDSAVAGWETRLSDIRAIVASVMGIRPLLVTVIVLLALTAALPHLRLVSRFVGYRKPASRLLIVLTTMTSFTFFAAANLDYHERGWVASRRTELVQRVHRLDEARRQLVVHTMLPDLVSRLTPNDLAYLRSFFTAVRTEPLRVELLELKAEQITSPAPSIKKANSEQTGAAADPEFEHLLDDLHAWVENPESRRPTLHEFARCDAERARIDLKLAESQVALIEIFKTVLGTSVADSLDPLLRPFVKSLVGTLSKVGLGAIFPKHVSDRASAAAWWSATLGSADVPEAERVAWRTWTFHLTTDRPGTSASRAESVQASIAELRDDAHARRASTTAQLQQAAHGGSSAPPLGGYPGRPIGSPRLPPPAPRLSFPIR